jgi:sugar phosphate isomerase/epimerase
MKRREFIQQSALVTAGALALSSFSLADKKKRVGLQLYTLRDIIGKDVKGTLEKVAKFGYKELEVYGYSDGKAFNMPYKELAKLVGDLGMRITSGHHLLGKSESNKALKGTLLNDWERSVMDAKEIGQEFMVVAYLTADERTSLDDYKRICEALNRGGEVCKKNGIRLNYHNHDFEFEKFDEQVAYDVMLKELDPKLVGMEMDLYWVYYAKQNPFNYFSKYPGRFEQWHVKDMDRIDPKRNANVGTGMIDFKPIFAKAKLAGLRHFYVEQETYPVSSMESIEKSIELVKKWS